MSDIIKSGTCVLFDMDGTVFDTENLYLSVWRGLAEKYDLPDIDDAYRSAVGGNDAMYMRILSERYPHIASRMEEIYAEGVERFTHILETEGPPLKPGVFEILGFLTERSIPCALASSTVTELVKKELRKAGIAGYFKTVIGGDMVSRGKPAPDIFIKACEALGGAPAYTFVLEDSYNGIRAAHAGGMKPVMIPDMLEPTDEIRDLCVKVCRDLHEAREYLKANI